MRTFLIGALAICLVGCSRQPPPQLALASCAGPNASACLDRWGETEPSRPAAAAIDIRPSVRAKTASASPAPLRHRARLAVKSAVMTAKAEPAASRIALLQEASKARPRPERSTAEAAQHGGAGLEPVSADKTDVLVAILMAGPDIKSVSELKGKTIAIDDRYSASGSTVRTAIVAAGAAQVQLSEGQGTAMNRLSNGEVPAAVVALVTPDAADKFPDISGYRIFHVPLSPESTKARP